MTLRQLHYVIFSRQQVEYENSQKYYRKLSRVTTEARRLYRQWELSGGDEELAPEYSIPPEWIVDEHRESIVPNVWKDAAGYVNAVRKSYHKDLWQDQPSYVEVWSEKGTVLGSIREVTERYGITVRVAHGFASAGMETVIGSLFETIKKDITVFYLGDHDPSGHCIEQDLLSKVITSSGKRFTMKRLAIHADDIEAFNLPPQKIKSTDTRASAFKRVYGSDAATVELDALPVDELRRRIGFGNYNRPICGTLFWPTLSS